MPSEVYLVEVSWCETQQGPGDWQSKSYWTRAWGRDTARWNALMQFHREHGQDMFDVQFTGTQKMTEAISNV